MKITELLALAEADGLLTLEDSARVTTAVATREKAGAMPWYLQALTAIGAWLAAAMLLGFIYGMFYEVIRKTPAGGVVAGVVLIAGATALQRARGGPFFGQVALAVSAAGHLLALFSVQEGRHTFGAVVVWAMVLAALFYRFNDAPLHRFLATMTALALSNWWVLDERGFGGIWIYLSLLAHLAGLAVLFLPDRGRRMWRPLAYALAVSLLGLVRSRTDFLSFHPSSWPFQVIVGAALVGLLVWAASGTRAARTHPLAARVVVCAVAALVFVSNAAILVALALLVLGFSLQDRPLLFLGGLSLPLFIALYYFSLQLSLRDKSLLLLATGAVLVILELILARIFRANTSAPVP
jgi:uncharacterized membrane protein